MQHTIPKPLNAPAELGAIEAGELITEAEAAAILKCARATLSNARSLKKGPPFVRVGTMIRYYRSRLTEWEV